MCSKGEQKAPFYWDRSVLYGITVYNRETNEPAFELGATDHMKKWEAIELCYELNKGWED